MIRRLSRLWRNWWEGNLIRHITPWFVLRWIDSHYPRYCWANMVVWKMFGNTDSWTTLSCENDRPKKGKTWTGYCGKHLFTIAGCDLCCHKCDGHMTAYAIAERFQGHIHVARATAIRTVEPSTPLEKKEGA